MDTALPVQLASRMKRFDVAVIGGGLVGCAASYYLAKLGASVVLIEQGEINRGASGRNAGSLHFQLEHRLVRHGQALAEHFAQVIPLTLQAIADWRGLEDELRTTLEVEMHGGLIVAETKDDLEQLEQRRLLQAEWGLETSLLSRPALRREAPYLGDSVIGAGYSRDEGHANPRLVTLAFARGALGKGAELLNGTRVEAIGRAGAEWLLRLKSRQAGVSEISAGKLLNAGGSWSADIASMVHIHLPIFPVPLLLNAIERSGRLIPHLVQHASQRLTVKQVADGNILVGGGWPARFPSSGSGIDCRRQPQAVPRNALRNVRLAARLIPAIRNSHLLRSWTGTTGVTADEIPLLGEVPEVPGFYVAAGGAGFTHGPTYARLISELMLHGRASHSIALYSPGRFSHINSFMVADGA